MQSTCILNDTATTEIYTLSLHDALPIFGRRCSISAVANSEITPEYGDPGSCRGPNTLKYRIVTVSSPNRLVTVRDRKSTRLNSSHSQISYAVFCLRHIRTTHSDNMALKV